MDENNLDDDGPDSLTVQENSVNVGSLPVAVTSSVLSTQDSGVASLPQGSAASSHVVGIERGISEEENNLNVEDSLTQNDLNVGGGVSHATAVPLNNLEAEADNNFNVEDSLNQNDLNVVEGASHAAVPLETAAENNLSEDGAVAIGSSAGQLNNLDMEAQNDLGLVEGTVATVELQNNLDIEAHNNLGVVEGASASVVVQNNLSTEVQSVVDSASIGIQNNLDGVENVVAGGELNNLDGAEDAAAGGELNNLDGAEDVAAGGELNNLDGAEDAAAVGELNNLDGAEDVAAGGELNNLDGAEDVAAVGELNNLDGAEDAAAVGELNNLDGAEDAAAGGELNNLDGAEDAAAGGELNNLDGAEDAAAGGELNNLDLDVPPQSLPTIEGENNLDAVVTALSSNNEAMNNLDATIATNDTTRAGGHNMEGFAEAQNNLDIEGENNLDTVDSAVTGRDSIAEGVVHEPENDLDDEADSNTHPPSQQAQVYSQSSELSHAANASSVVAAQPTSNVVEIPAVTASNDAPTSVSVSMQAFKAKVPQTTDSHTVAAPHHTLTEDNQFDDEEEEEEDDEQNDFSDDEVSSSADVQTAPQPSTASSHVIPSSYTQQHRRNWTATAAHVENNFVMPPAPTSAPVGRGFSDSGSHSGGPLRASVDTTSYTSLPPAAGRGEVHTIYTV